MCDRFRCKKMILLPGLLLILWGEPARCLEETGDFTFDGDIRHFAVATNTVYIATEERLYHLNHDLTLVQSLTQRGILKGGPRPNDALFYRVSETDKLNATFSINVLLPIVKDNTLISCGVTDNECGYCEQLDLTDISKVLYRELIHVGSPWRSSESVGFLVNVEKRSTETYILAAIEQREDKSQVTSCHSGSKAVQLHNTNNNQEGSIFTKNDEFSAPSIKRVGNVQFVDGFQIDSIIYLFSNLPSGDKSSKVRLIWLEAKTDKTETLKSLRGATLSVSDGAKGSRLLASSVIPGGPPVLWSGVFTVDGGLTSTELVLFDISPDLTGDTDVDEDFCSVCSKQTQTPKTLKLKKVLFRQNYMTSVLAVRQRAWVVFFIGTGDGQLIKLAVDENFHTVCPRLLYRANKDRQVFPKIHLDPVDRKHVYVPFQNQMKRVPVSKCGTYTNVQDCWSAQDPYCVWCSSESSCTFEDECQDSDWLSIPDDSQQKMVSNKVVKDGTGQRPEISSITPSVVSIYGRNHAVLSGRNLNDVTRVRIQAEKCRLQESPVWSNTGVNLTLHIPSTDFEDVFEVCVVLPDGSCHGNAKITYRPSPSCIGITPSSTWVSGKRKITLTGSHLEFVEGVMHSHALQEVRPPRNINFQNLTYDTPAAENIGTFTSSVFLKVANETLACSTTITYYPDPEFTSFTTTRTGDDVRITIEKKADKLDLTKEELSVWGVHEGNQYPCIMEAKETTKQTDFFICEIQRTPEATFQHLIVTYGDKTVRLGPPASLHQLIAIIRFLLIPCIIVVMVIICRWQKKLTAKMNKL